MISISHTSLGLCIIDYNVGHVLEKVTDVMPVPQRMITRAQVR